MRHLVAVLAFTLVGKVLLPGVAEAQNTRAVRRAASTQRGVVGQREVLQRGVARPVGQQHWQPATIVRSPHRGQSVLVFTRALSEREAATARPGSKFLQRRLRSESRPGDLISRGRDLIQIQQNVDPSARRARYIVDRVDARPLTKRQVSELRRRIFGSFRETRTR